MAKRLDPGLVDQLATIVNSINGQLAEYSIDPDFERDPEDTGAVRKIRVIAAGLQAIAEQVGRIAPSVMSPAVPTMISPPPTAPAAA